MSPDVVSAVDLGSRVPMVSLVDHLAARHEKILGAWDATVNADPYLMGSDDLFRGEFRDHIPQVFAKFLGTLLAGHPTCSAQDKAPATVPAGEDGPHRWQHSYDLWEVALEWNYLHHCLLDELEAARTALPALAPDLFNSAHHSLATLVHMAMADSAEQFARQQQKEANCERNKLERAIAHFLENGRDRAALWRESAHDLRGQLTIITSAAALLEVADLEEPLRIAALGTLHSGVGAFKKVLADALNVAAQGSDQEKCQWESFDAGILLGRLCAATQPLARERGLSLRFRGPCPLAVEGDPGKVRRIAQNLLLDALSRTSEGGVTVSWRIEDADCWSLEVRDTGPGMLSGDSAAPAFERSLTGDEGLGLPIIERLRQLLGARLHLEAAPDEGTVYTVVFPRRYAA